MFFRAIHNANRRRQGEWGNLHYGCNLICGRAQRTDKQKQTSKWLTNSHDCGCTTKDLCDCGESYMPGGLPRHLVRKTPSSFFMHEPCENCGVELNVFQDLLHPPGEGGGTIVFVLAQHPTTRSIVEPSPVALLRREEVATTTRHRVHDTRAACLGFRPVATKAQFAQGHTSCGKSCLQCSAGICDSTMSLLELGARHRQLALGVLQTDRLPIEACYVVPGSPWLRSARASCFRTAHNRHASVRSDCGAT